MNQSNRMRSFAKRFGSVSARDEVAPKQPGEIKWNGIQRYSYQLWSIINYQRWRLMITIPYITVVFVTVLFDFLKFWLWLWDVLFCFGLFSNFLTSFLPSISSISFWLLGYTGICRASVDLIKWVVKAPPSPPARCNWIDYFQSIQPMPLFFFVLFLFCYFFYLIDWPEPRLIATVGRAWLFQPIWLIWSVISMSS